MDYEFGMRAVSLILGLFFSFLIPYLVMPKSINFRIHPWHLALLILFTSWHLLRSATEVAWDILTPVSKSQPKIFELPLDNQRSVQVSMLANIISLTPGTLAINVKGENRALIIHVMFSQQQDDLVKFIKEKLEPKIMKVIQYD